MSEPETFHPPPGGSQNVPLIPAIEQLADPRSTAVAASFGISSVSFDHIWICVLITVIRL